MMVDDALHRGMVGYVPATGRVLTLPAEYTGQFLSLKVSTGWEPAMELGAVDN